jgi:hypothetical protein
LYRARDGHALFGIGVVGDSCGKMRGALRPAASSSCDERIAQSQHRLLVRAAGDAHVADLDPDQQAGERCPSVVEPIELATVAE